MAWEQVSECVVSSVGSAEQEKQAKEKRCNGLKWLMATPQKRIEHQIPEHPLLHACCGQDHFGDVNIDRNPDVKPDVVADITRRIPYPDDSFAAAFADFPWTAAFKRQVSSTMKELLRVAPIVYTISPWTYGSSRCRLDWVKVAWQPGVNQALLFSRYVRVEKRGGVV